MRSTMLWSRCRQCGDVIHEWGTYWHRWHHERARLRGLPDHPAGVKTYDHRARPSDFATTNIADPRIDPAELADEVQL